jgi:hypothetical protein
MRTQRLTRVLAVLILAALGASAMIAADVTGKPHKPHPPLKFTLIGKVDAAHVIDNEPAGDSPGDSIVFSQQLYDESGTREVGRDHAICTRTMDAEGSYLCQGAFLLRRGQITIAGIDPPATVTRHPLVVTGGSGRYRGVSGEITVHHVSAIEDRFDFKLSR